MPDRTSPLVMIELYGIVQLAVVASADMVHAPLPLVYWDCGEPDGADRPR